MKTIEKGRSIATEHARKPGSLKKKKGTNKKSAGGALAKREGEEMRPYNRCRIIFETRNWLFRQGGGGSGGTKNRGDGTKKELS